MHIVSLVLIIPTGLLDPVRPSFVHWPVTLRLAGSDHLFVRWYKKNIWK